MQAGPCPWQSHPLQIAAPRQAPAPSVPLLIHLGGGGALPCVRVSPACDAPAPSCNDGSQHSLLSRVMRNILWIMWLMLSCSHSSRCERKERLISATE